MPHYRDSKAGEFLKDPAGGTPEAVRAIPPFLRFCRLQGAADTLAGTRPACSLLRAAELDWHVDHRPILTEREVGIGRVHGYRVLVRPDRDQVMSVVATSYKVAENRDLADAAFGLARSHDPDAALIGAASFGRTGERTLFAYRITETARGEFLVLLVYNRHGGDGAVRAQLAFFDVGAQAVLTPPGTWASSEIPQVGARDQRLASLAESPLIERFLEENDSPRRLLQEARWSPSRTQRLLYELRGDPQDREPISKDGFHLKPSDRAACHPARHLAPRLDSCKTAMGAYRQVCFSLDCESEACERGDFTRDRDERLALGAGTKLKHKAWRWLVGAAQ